MVEQTFGGFLHSLNIATGPTVWSILEYENQKAVLFGGESSDGKYAHVLLLVSALQKFKEGQALLASYKTSLQYQRQGNHGAVGSATTVLSSDFVACEVLEGGTSLALKLCNLHR